MVLQKLLKNNQEVLENNQEVLKNNQEVPRERQIANNVQALKKTTTLNPRKSLPTLNRRAPRNLMVPKRVYARFGCVVIALMATTVGLPTPTILQHRQARRVRAPPTKESLPVQTALCVNFGQKETAKMVQSVVLHMIAMHEVVQISRSLSAIQVKLHTKCSVLLMKFCWSQHFRKILMMSTNGWTPISKMMMMMMHHRHKIKMENRKSSTKKRNSCGLCKMPSIAVHCLVNFQWCNVLLKWAKRRKIYGHWIGC
mmetsp:Transcript_8036/g.12223  ORF Transcript_8036/g.12223 Transcript_8036/m.12223 type:complete len:255 (+) Transcript_8036:383-1147(+)